MKKSVALNPEYRKDIETEKNDVNSDVEENIEENSYSALKSTSASKLKGSEIQEILAADKYKNNKGLKSSDRNKLLTTYGDRYDAFFRNNGLRRYISTQNGFDLIKGDPYVFKMKFSGEEYPLYYDHLKKKYTIVLPGVAKNQLWGDDLHELTINLFGDDLLLDTETGGPSTFLEDKAAKQFFKVMSFVPKKLIELRREILGDLAPRSISVYPGLDGDISFHVVDAKGKHFDYHRHIDE